MKRGYQNDFSLHSQIVHDHASRRRKAATMLAVLREVVSNLAQARVLDVGASTGVIDAELAQHCGEVCGIDIDAHAIEAARQQFVAHNLRFELGDAMALGAPDRSIDVVICAHVYEHVPDAKRLMSEIDRVLKPAGVCYFSAGNRYAWREPHYQLPLLSVVPKFLAHRYLRALGRGNFYYEEHLGYFALRRLVAAFEVLDYTARLVDQPVRYGTDYMFAPGSLRQRAAQCLVHSLPSLCPGYIWVLRKPADHATG
jgi:2-polyprenyl-3-methyl-5-hydroxy-6-metoxy-1,4-benzoquinol methylase